MRNITGISRNQMMMPTLPTSRSTDYLTREKLKYNPYSKLLKT